ncbi:TonB-dependent receptor [Pseudobacter ginsenosidimutans]|uniref:Iron complex outermembrane receptor protein n=1 Tax=Pseudobacter ginsenosidimutans TaxID=661488 RepID=A0A4Q7N1E8_9BACT|nr:TonB-dependent receptor [Pseudobacter ginsenosidimutans]QEC43084.1 TonB-dependent receptor [Pseudobacter ginsenosidimutans]RZS74439.1 iron complex outermembrane receptor protein [Pseudobacter ginsenosidimutans]
MFRIYTILLVCLFWQAAAHGQTHHLTGQVRNSHHAPLKGVALNLLPRGWNTVTDSAGRFSFGPIVNGDYIIIAQFPGYRDQRLQVKIRGRSADTTIVMRQLVTELEEVVVRDNQVQVRKAEESLNLEVVKTDFIHRHLGGSLMKTLERLPGIKTIGIGSGQSKPLIRGLGFNRVVVVENGIKHEGQQWGADHGLELDQFAAGEVELIKGAASFVYGSDAIGGAIDVKPVSLPAEKSIGGSADLVGKSNNHLYGGSVNLYSRSKQWFANARISWQDYADYRVPADTVYVYSYAVGLHKNYLRNTAGRESGLHFSGGYAGDRFRSVFYVSKVFSKSGFFANAHGLEPRRVNAELHDHSSRDILQPRQEVNHFKLINRSSLEAGKHLLELDLGYQRNFRQEFNQYVNHGYMPPLYPDTLGVPSNLEREFDKHVYSFSFRDKITWGKHTITAGLNSEFQDNKISGWSFLVPAFRQFTAGAFLYDKYKLNDRFLLHGAIRFDHGQLKTFGYTDWFSSRINIEGSTVNQHLIRADALRRNFQSWVWSLGMNYNLGSFSAKLNLGKSFRMPIAKELSANGVNYHYFSYEKGDPTLSPEQSYQIDLSLGWEAGKWSVLLSPFYNYFPNYIYLNPTAFHDYDYGAGNQVFQYAQSRVFRYGGELQARFRFVKNLAMEFTGEYLYAEQLSGNKKGYTLPFSPPPSGLINLTWSPQWNGSFRKTYFSLDYRITTEQNKIVPPEKKTPGYNVFNFQAGSRFVVAKQSLQMSLQVQNIFNTKYMNHTSFYRLIELPEQGRNIVLLLKVPFAIK